MPLPIGYDDFRELIDNKLDFVDKSLFIKELLDDRGTKVAVITRPRRFGKTLNLSMLRYFLAAEVDSRPTQGLFDTLKIAQVEGEFLKHQGQYPVIFLTFKDVKSLSFPEALKAVRLLIQKLYRAHGILSDSSRLVPGEKKLFQQFFEGTVDKSDLEQSLGILSELLYKHHGKKVYVLIDEYDTPVQASYMNGYYNDMIGFTRNLLSAVLKTNSYLEKGVVTGVVRIAKESLFSGLNNVEVYSVLQDRYSEYFGFTEEEVDHLLTQADMQNRAEEIRRWYNGYQFGHTTIYNPWSIVNCINKNNIQPYWVNTSDNALIRQQILKSPLDFKEQLEQLLQRNTIEKPINEHVVFGDLTKNPTALWSLLIMSGYLKVTDKRFTEYGETIATSAIPNQEIYVVYYGMISEWLSEGQDSFWYRDFIAGLLAGDIDSFRKNLQQVMEQTASIHDMAKEPEAFYHGLMLGFTASLSKDQYTIQSNRESGLGRFDIVLIPKDTQKLGIILELKAVNLPKKLSTQNTQEFIEHLLEEEAKVALKQIQEKHYVQELESRGIKKSIAIGLAFAGKLLSVVGNEYSPA